MSELDITAWINARNRAAYRTARNFLQSCELRLDVLGSRLTGPRPEEETAAITAELLDLILKRFVARATIDRLRFVSKHSRSRYAPHQGAKEKARRAAGFEPDAAIVPTEETSS